VVSEVAVLDCFAHELLSPTSVALALTASVYAPSGALSAKRAYIRVEGASIRVYRDGTDPTASDGTPYYDKDTLILNGINDIKNFRCIAISGSPKVWVDYAG
jgi:hypothetical protein